MRKITIIRLILIFSLTGMLKFSKASEWAVANAHYALSTKDVVVRGNVTSEAGIALPNVSVQVKGTAIGTTTDSTGSFSLTVPDANAVLVFSSIGFAVLEYPLNGETEINVVLKGTQQLMDQVVVIGYGTQRRQAVTGAISRVTGDQLAKQPLLTPVQGIQGLAPGIQVVGSSQPGTQPRVTIRGLNTILTNENPLYVVDGVLTEDIRNINSADVTSVDVLKDGAAAIYGSRAANGVILITTKKGRSGKPNVSFDTYVGFRKLTNLVKMADAAFYTEYSSEARAYDEQPALTPASDANTNWYDVISKNGLVQNYGLSVNGGSENVTYLFSAGYLGDKGVLEGANYQRLTFRSNNEYRLSERIKLGNVLNVSVTKNANKPNGVFTDAYRQAPTAPVRDNTGNYGTQPDLSVSNPLATLDLANDFSNGQRYQGNLYGEVAIIKGLTFRTAWGFDKSNDDNQTYNPVYKYGIFERNTSELFVKEAKRFYWVWDNILNYNTKINNIHNIGITLGHTAERDRGRSFRLRATNIPPDRNLWYLSQGDPTVTLDTQDPETGINLQRRSLFARANYGFMDKYNISGVLRRDGSSAFPENQKYGTFYSIAGSWIISEENFLSESGVIDFLKLRGGYAKLGNDGISRLFNNELAALTSITITNPYGFPNGLVSGITFDQIKDAAATWETTKSMDVGLEFGFLKRRLTGEVSYYNKLTNAYIKVPIAPFVDNNGILSQAADVRNKGVEVTLNWNDRGGDDFSYRFGVNGTFNRNNVDKIRGGIDLKEGGLGNGQVTTSTVEGQPIGSFWVYQVEGIFQTEAEIAASPVLPGTKPGDFKYVDINNDGSLDERDRIFAGSYQPKFYYGINGGINWKQLDFSIDCYGNAGNKVYNGKKGVRFGNDNIEASRVSRWTPTNTNTNEPRASNNIPTPSTYFVESGSFFRINNITLGYSLPNRMLENAFMSNVRFYVTAQNPLIIKKFSGFSPELPGSNALNSGIELSVYPTSATYMAGVTINFK
ncbi:MAG: TonB-dependent receptor [Niabella sp.]